MIGRIVALFGRRSGYRIVREVPNMGQSVDIVAAYRNCLVAIEVKRSDWQRALNQCSAHRAVADFICIAIGTKTVSAALQKEATRLNYGIIHCPPGENLCTWAARPKKNPRVWKPQQDLFKRRVLEIDNGN
jgi:hypothetical protein